MTSPSTSAGSARASGATQVSGAPRAGEASDTAPSYVRRDRARASGAWSPRGPPASEAPTLGVGLVARVELHLLPVEQRRPVRRVEALARLRVLQRPRRGVVRPLLRARAVAGVQPHDGAVRGSAAGDIQALA